MTDRVVFYLAEEIANQVVTAARLRAENESLRNQLDEIVEQTGYTVLPIEDPPEDLQEDDQDVEEAETEEDEG